MSASNKKKIRKEAASAELTEKQRAERKEAKKLKIYTVTFVTVMALIVLVAVGVATGRWVSRSGILERGTTAVTIGEHKLNNAQLNYYFVDTVNSYYSDFYSTFGSSAASYIAASGGPDFTKPLDEQVYEQDTGKTWADFFTDTAISRATSTYALYDEAVAKGHTLTDAEKTSIDNSVQNMQTYATLYGYGSISDYLKVSYGRGATEKSFREYCEVSQLAQSYYNAYSDALTYDDAAIQAYNSEHEMDYNSYTYASYTLYSSSFLEGGTQTESGTTTYSDEEKEAALKAAKAAADSLLAAESVEDLDKAIAALEINKENTSAASTKNTDVFYPSLNKTYQEWVSDSRREEGDKKVFPIETTSTDDQGASTTTTTGYYVVYFQSSNANNFPLANVRHILIGFKSANNSSTYTDEEKEAAKTAAEELYQKWKDGEATEESFTALVADNSTDTGSKDNGGLYEKVYPGQMVQAFNDWIFKSEEPRKPGDTGLVETTYGWHIMYYSSDCDITYREYMIDNQLRSDDLNEWYEGLVDAKTHTEGDTSKLSRDLVLLTTSVS